MDLANHEMGLELQLIELTEQCERARVQDREEDAQRIQHEMALLQEEMALTTERMVILADQGVNPQDADPNDPEGLNPKTSSAA